MPDKITVLIADDDANTCTTLAHILEKKGYATTVTDNGQRAVDLAKEKVFDVILMDVKMPVMGGVEAYKKIKENRPSTVIIFMTAFALEDLASDMLGEGAYAVIDKPYEIDTVVNMIQKSQGGLLVTLVDADIRMRDIMQKALEEKGYSVSVCKSGEEAIALASKNPRDIFFIDTKLPVLNSLETYKEIRKVNPKAVVVMMTAYRQETEELVRQAIEKGAYSCLYKPFDMNEAIEIIEKIAEKKKK
jgi:two-component system response regulator HydG